MLPVVNLGGDDAGVARLELLRACVQVLVGGNELFLVECAPVTDDDLGRILVGHDHCWLGKSASESIRVVWLQWFLQHTCVEVVSYFKLILGQ